jgi:hypothetical protein
MTAEMQVRGGGKKRNPAFSEKETSFVFKKREKRRHPDERRDPAGRKITMRSIVKN